MWNVDLRADCQEITVHEPVFFPHTYGEFPHTDFGIGIFPPTDFGIGIFPLQISGLKAGRGISPRETGILARNFQSKSVSK